MAEVARARSLHVCQTGEHKAWCSLVFGDLPRLSFSLPCILRGAGVYDRLERVWRVKSKHNVCSISSYDLDGDGVPELICGWSSGRVRLALICMCTDLKRGRAAADLICKLHCGCADPLKGQRAGAAAFEGPRCKPLCKYKAALLSTHASASPVFVMSPFSALVAPARICGTSCTCKSGTAGGYHLG